MTPRTPPPIVKDGVRYARIYEGFGPQKLLMVVPATLVWPEIRRIVGDRRHLYSDVGHKHGADK